MTKQEYSKPTVWAVIYLPTKQGLLFAGLKPEIEAVYEDREDATGHCLDLEMGGPLDEMHIGYRVREISVDEIPAGMFIG